MSLFRAISTVAGFTLLSRVFGFIRDILIARYLGAGASADAFFVAFKLPNFFRRLFAEGAFSAGFVPLFSAALGKDITPESRQKAQDLANDILSWFFPVLLAVLLLFEWMMAPVMLGLTGGFAGDEGKFSLAVLLGHFTFPFLFFIALVSFLAAILNAFGRFSAAAFAPIILNICMISALLLWGNSPFAAKGLSIAVSLSGFLQMLWLWRAVKKTGLSIRLLPPKPSPHIRKLLHLVAPAALGAGIIQINLLLDTLLAARFLDQGAVSWLFYADRLNQLPLGVIGVAIGTVMLPAMARLISSNQNLEAERAQNQALELALILSLPAAVALYIVPDLLIAGLFERAAFSPTDSLKTSAALAAYALGLPAYMLAKSLTPAFYARKDTRTPVKLSLISLAINLVANLSLIGPLGHVGLALATALAAWVNTALHYSILKKRGHLIIHKSLKRRAMAACLSALVMGAGLYGLKYYWLMGSIPLSKTLFLIPLVVCGLFLYGLVGFLTGALKKSDLQFLRRP